MHTVTQDVLADSHVQRCARVTMSLQPMPCVTWCACTSAADGRSQTVSPARNMTTTGKDGTETTVQVGPTTVTKAPTRYQVKSRDPSRCRACDRFSALIHALAGRLLLLYSYQLPQCCIASCPTVRLKQPASDPADLLAGCALDGWWLCNQVYDASEHHAARQGVRQRHADQQAEGSARETSSWKNEAMGLARPTPFRI
jgi:hypothetical protein